MSKIYLLAFPVYFLLIWANPFSGISQALGNNHPIVLVLMLMGFFIAFNYSDEHKVSNKKSIAFGLTLTLAICAFQLLFIWNASVSDNKIIGGLIPYKDSQGYFFAADLLLNGIQIPAHSISAARPFYSGLLSFLLFLTNSNLQAVHVLLAALSGGVIFVVAQKVREIYGAIAAALFITVLIYYAKSYFGYLMTETVGLIFGCLAMFLLLTAAQHKNKTALLVGLVTLTIALFIRPGAFFVLPLMILWAAWVFRKGSKISYDVAGIAILSLIATHVIFNQITAARIVEPGAVAFGNFSYSLYGQVRGGTGWHSAIRELGTTDPNVVLRITVDFFLKHPFSFFIASAKAYRDFLLMDNGLFGGLFNSVIAVNLELFLRLALLGFSVCGVWAFYKTKSDLGLLQLFTLAGVILSVPFVPPIDGGSRFYAATIPFLFLMPAAGIGYLFKEKEEIAANKNNHSVTISVVFLSAVIIAFPMLVHVNPPLSTPPEPLICEDEQESYIARIYQGTYIDIASAESCGIAPVVCIKNFIENSADKKTDDFFHALLTQTDEIAGTLRIAPIVNHNDGNFYYLVGSPEQIAFEKSGDWVTGCAVEIRTKNQRIYKVMP